MDFETARHILISQTVSPGQDPEAFIHCLRQGVPPVPGQITSILLALKTAAQGLGADAKIERSLGHAFFVLTYESRQLYSQGEQSGVDWPPLLNEDLSRIAEAVRQIWACE